MLDCLDTTEWYFYKSKFIRSSSNIELDVLMLPNIFKRLSIYHEVFLCGVELLNVLTNSAKKSYYGLNKLESKPIDESA